MPNSTGRSWLRYFQYDEGRDSPGNTRNVILVVVILIATVAFQTGVNPPAIYASQKGLPYNVFLLSNTLALSTSIFMIMSVTNKFPFQSELRFAIVAMLCTYGSAVYAVMPKEYVGFRYILVAIAAPSVVPVFIQWWFKNCGEPTS